MNKIKMRKERIMVRMIQCSIMGTSLLATTALNIKASLGDNVQNLANSTASELLSFADVAGLIGVVIGFACLFINQRNLGKTILISVGVGYFLLKYAQPIWNMFRGMI